MGANLYPTVSQPKALETIKTLQKKKLEKVKLKANKGYVLA